MSFFDSPDFKPMERISGRAMITVTKNGVSFSKQAVAKLSYPHYVQIYINKKDRLLGVKACEEKDSNSIKFVNSSKDKVDYVRWNNSDFTSEINSLVSKEIAEKGYKIEAEYLVEENALLFNFDKLQIIEN